MSQISIIIPNYNHAKYLPQRLESVYNQTYQDFEVILLDDCSNDDSVTILNTYAKHLKTSHVVFNDKNSGNTFTQWAKGIALAKGDFIWIAESDDVADLSFLEISLFAEPDTNVYDMRLTQHEDGWIYGVFCTERKDKKNRDKENFEPEKGRKTKGDQSDDDI